MDLLLLLLLASRECLLPVNANPHNKQEEEARKQCSDSGSPQQWHYVCLCNLSARHK